MRSTDKMGDVCTGKEELVKTKRYRYCKSNTSMIARETDINIQKCRDTYISNCSDHFLNLWLKLVEYNNCI